MGAFVSSDLHRSPKFYGNAESFVFTIKPDERVYRWERGNSYFIQHVDENGLTIGGGEGYGAAASPRSSLRPPLWP